jgi:hypothetical protein
MKKAIQDGIVEFLRASCSLDASQVKVERHDGTKKAHAHLLVSMPIGPQMLGTDTVVLGIDEDTDTPQMQTAGDRRVVVSIHGYHEESFDWLTTATEHLTWGYPGAKVLRKHGLSVEPIGPVRDVSSRLETDIEPHYIQEFEVKCGVLGTAVALTEAKTITVDFNTD